MDNSTINTLIGAAISIATLIAVSRINRKFSKRDKREEEVEEKERKHHDRIFNHMVILREETRNQIRRLEEIEQKIRDGGDPGQEFDEAVFAIRQPSSKHWDVVLEVSLFHPDVRHKWLAFASERSGYIDRLAGALPDRNAHPSLEDDTAIDRLRIARGNFIDTIKIAAAEIGFPLLMRDVSLDSTEEGSP